MWSQEKTMNMLKNPKEFEKFMRKVSKIKIMARFEFRLKKTRFEAL